MTKLSLRASNLVARIGGIRFHVAEDEETGARMWREGSVPAQDADWKEEPALRIDSLSQGHGYVFADRGDVYASASGFDCSAPGKAATWPRYNTSATVTVTTAPTGKGWLYYYRHSATKHFVFLVWGNKVTKFATDDTQTPWAVLQTHTLSVDVPGKCAFWQGCMYVPQGNSNDFIEITIGTAGTDTTSSGPSDRRYSHFASWETKLVGLVSNPTSSASELRVCEASFDPLVSESWGLPYDVGEAASPITSVASYGRYLLVGKAEGLISFDESALSHNEFVDLKAVYHVQNCEGMGEWNGGILVPHLAGFVHWAPESWLYIGPERDGYLDSESASDDRGWGWVKGVASHGNVAYQAIDDRRLTFGYILSMRYPVAGDSRGPVIPHMHQKVTGYGLRDIIVASTDERAYLVALNVTDSDGEIAQLEIFELPIHGFSPATDVTIGHANADAQIRLPWYSAPGAHIKKLYRKVELGVYFGAESAHPGLRIRAYIKNGATSTNYLLTADGTADTVVRTSGPHAFYFPQGATAIGDFVSLELEVPAVGGGESATKVEIRYPLVLRLNARPQRTKVVNCQLVLDKGQFLDGGMGKLSARKLKDLLYEMEENEGSVEVKDAWGYTFRALIGDIQVEELEYTGIKGPIFLVTCTLRELEYA
jgi:hypothetical protein